MPERKPAVTGEILLHQGLFVAFKKLEWTDAHGEPRQWETADRMAKGAVLIIARLLPSDRLLLIRQYRPPARRYVIEFPAGLTDPGEMPAEAAARELREETGYTAGNLRVYPAAYTTPGLSNEAVHMVLAEIDEDAPENRDPKTDFDESEMIETILIPHSELPAFYRREVGAGNAFDSKLAAYILSMHD